MDRLFQDSKKLPYLHCIGAQMVATVGKNLKWGDGMKIKGVGEKYCKRLPSAINQ